MFYVGTISFRHWFQKWNGLPSKLPSTLIGKFLGNELDRITPDHFQTFFKLLDFFGGFSSKTAQDPENENIENISGWVFHELAIRLNQYGTDAKKALIT